MTHLRILVTGSAGRLGRAAVKELVARGHTVVGFDLRPTPGLPAEQSVVGTLQDVGALNGAMVGADVLIHLAATPDDARFPRGAAPDDGDNFLSELVPNNIVGGYHVLEAARKAGVKKLILASTGQVVDGYVEAGRMPVMAEWPTHPKYLYASTKVFLEALGSAYAHAHGMKVLAVRLGWCPRDAVQVAQIAASAEDQDVFLSPGDAGRFFACAVECESARLPTFAPLFVTSRARGTPFYDLAPAQELVGFEPQDYWPTGADAFS